MLRSEHSTLPEGSAIVRDTDIRFEPYENPDPRAHGSVIKDCHCGILPNPHEHRYSKYAYRVYFYDPERGANRAGESDKDEHLSRPDSGEPQADPDANGK